MDKKNLSSCVDSYDSLLPTTFFVVVVMFCSI